MTVHSSHASKPGRGISLLRLDWSVTLGIVGMHVGAVAALFFFSWTGLVFATVLFWATAGLGITMGYHRLLTHRSFKTYKWVEYVLTSFGCLAWQGGPAQWIGTHRLHHKHADHEEDPHTPNHGFTWSHIFWCLHKESEGIGSLDAAKDILRDTGLRILNRIFWAPQLALTVMLYIIGALIDWNWLSYLGASWVLWAVCLRTVAVYHVTWFVNSASHTWGYRNFETKDNSRNLWWVSLLSFGEGWHNNHHKNQRSAAHGIRWYELDITYLSIRLLQRLGLAWDVVEPKARPG